MTDSVLRHEKGPAIARKRRFPAWLARALDRTLFAHPPRYDLHELPERLRRDVGLTRMVLVATIALAALLAAPPRAVAQDAQVGMWSARSNHPV